VIELDAIAREHLRRLARTPRPTGSPEAAEARRYCADVLRGQGFSTIEHPFEYSAAVGRFGTPVAGVAALLSIALGARLVGAIVILLAGAWLARRGVLALPFLRREGINLEARRDNAPTLWLVAHIDSKSQPVPLLVRSAGIILLAIAWIGGWPYLAIVGALPVIASVVGRASAGAVDNASGVATVLSAASLLGQAPVGILITDAEELGLAGARAWCVKNAPSVAINCDGVDDDGQPTLMWTRPRARRLEAAFKGVRAIPLVPGVLVDSVAFSGAKWEAITLSRGTLGTLRRIHTRKDDLEHLRGDGIAAAARVLADAAISLTERR